MPKRPLGASILDVPAELVEMIVGHIPARDVFSLKSSCRLLCARVGEMLPIALKKMRKMLDGPPVPFKAACVLKHNIPQPVGGRACLYAGKRYEYSWGEQLILGPHGPLPSNYEKEQFKYVDEDGQTYCYLHDEKVAPWKEYFVDYVLSENILLKVLDPEIARRLVLVSLRKIFFFSFMNQLNNPAAFQLHSVLGNNFSGIVTVRGKWIVGLTWRDELCWTNKDNEIRPCCKIQQSASNQIWLTKYGLLFYDENERLSRAFILVPK